MFHTSNIRMVLLLCWLQSWAVTIIFIVGGGGGGGELFFYELSMAL